MRVFAAVLLSMGLAATPLLAKNAGEAGKEETPAAVTTAAAPDKPVAVKAESSLIESEVQDLRSLVEEQRAELEAQRAALKSAEAKMKELEERISPSPAQPSPAPARAVETAASPAIGPASASNATLAQANPGQRTAQTDTNGTDQPTSWKFKGVTFTPGGFFAAESVWRQRALSADVNTPFTSTPLPGSSQYNVGEFNASGRQSRIAMLVQGTAHNVKLGGYYEADFLSAGTTSNDNQSNSYTLRQRQFWAQAAFNSGFTLTGGQMWSLVTQTAKGLDNRTEVLPENIDAQYNVGFSWAREYGVRFVQNFNNKVWLGFSVEEPQTTFKVGGTTAPFIVGAAGNGGGLYNPTANYSFSMTPDFVVKAAFEPGFGHYEVFGLVSTFRDRIFPTGVAPSNSKTFGGGGGANAWFPFDKGKINFGLHAVVGDGVGRYGSAGVAPDATLRPDGTLAPIRSYQGLATLAIHDKKWDVYFHAGEEYAARTQFISGTPAVLIPNEGYGAIGFNNAGCWTEPGPGAGGYAPGALANCSGNIKDIIEGTAGLWYSFYTGPYGTLKMGMQYSYVKLNTWTGLGATGVCTSSTNPNCTPSGTENMVFTSLRYYIP
ncbi:MAG: keratin [Acidobacteriia bacterium]|nr:keratin [Terriglobia bacterium]